MGHLKNVETDIVITGGSLEGCIAALELAKKGYQVLLTEKKGSLGGAPPTDWKSPCFRNWFPGRRQSMPEKYGRRQERRKGLKVLSFSTRNASWFWQGC